MSDSSNEAAQADETFPSQGRLLGIDYGTKRIGIAISTYEQTIASPLENYTRRDKETDRRHLVDVAKEYLAVGLVVGLPVHMSGDESQKSREAREFGSWLSQGIGLPVCYWDERYTSAIAEEHLLAAELSKKKRKARMDMLAAQLILQSFLDAADREQSPGAI